MILKIQEKNLAKIARALNNVNKKITKKSIEKQNAFKVFDKDNRDYLGQFTPNR